MFHAPTAFKTLIHPLNIPAPFSPLNICDRRPKWPSVCCPPHPALFVLTIDLGTVFSLTPRLHVHSRPLSLSPVQMPPPPHKSLSPVKVTFLYPHFPKLPFLTVLSPQDSWYTVVACSRKVFLQNENSLFRGGI